MKDILKFLDDLSRNNNREWMLANKKESEASKKQFEAFIEQLIAGIGSFDEQIGEQQAKSCVFRLNRDIRFSNDKSPYKTNFGAAIQKGGKKSPYATYYFHLQPENQSFLAAGVYMPLPDILAKIRQEIDYNPEEFKNIVSAPVFAKTFGGLSGEKLSRPPKGYDPSNPMIEYLKFKNYVVSVPISDKELISPGVFGDLINRFKPAKPMNHFLNRAILG